MPIVDNLVNDLVNKHEVLSNGLFVEHAAVVSEDLHHAIDNVQDGRRGHISLACRHKVYSKLLREEVVDTIDVLKQKQKLNE